MKAENVKLGIAPIGWTNDDLLKLVKRILEQCVSEMALAGSPVAKWEVNIHVILTF